jgi:RNA polymerase sigma-70 factor (ECF subfamily)
LINTIHRTVDTHLKAKRRDVRREVSIEVLGKMDQSAIDFLQAFADRGPSPSEPLREREAAVALADQLAKLRPQYREVIVLRNLQGLSFQEVAQRMDRSTNAVRMLWLRAIEKFKHVYQPSD